MCWHSSMYPVGWETPREDLQARLKSKDKFDTPLEVPFITHWLHNMTHDQVLDMLKYLGMGNRPEDKVKGDFCSLLSGWS